MVLDHHQIPGTVAFVYRACGVGNDQLFNTALGKGHIGRVVSASSVPVLELMDRDRIIDAGESRRSEHIIFDPVFFHIIQTIIIRVMKGSQDQLRRRLHLYLQALPGHAGKNDPVFGNPLFQTASAGDDFGVHLEGCLHKPSERNPV